MVLKPGQELDVRVGVLKPGEVIDLIEQALARLIGVEQGLVHQAAVDGQAAVVDELVQFPISPYLIGQRVLVIELLYRAFGLDVLAAVGTEQCPVLGVVVARPAADLAVVRLGLGEALNELAPLLHLLLVDAHSLSLCPQAPGEAKGEAVDHRAVPALDGNVNLETVTKHDTLKLGVEGADDGGGIVEGLDESNRPAARHSAGYGVK